MKRKYYDVGGKKFTLNQLYITSKLRDGLVHKQIAEDLDKSKGTIDHTVADTFHTKGFKNSKEMVAHASANGLEPNGRFKGKKLPKPVPQKPPQKQTSPSKR